MTRRTNPLRQIPGLLVVRSRARVEVDFTVDGELLTMQLRAWPHVEHFNMRVEQHVRREIQRS